MSLSTINVSDIKEKLYNKLKPTGWADPLKAFILSVDFDKILESLLSLTAEGKRFTPPLKTVFRPFEEIHFNEVKVILMDETPHAALGQADGLAYSVNNGTKPVRLMRLLNEINKESKNFVQEHTTDLSDWSKQGVLLLNTSLTTQVGKEVSHHHIWDPFIAYMFDMLNSMRAGIVFIFPGELVAKYGRLIGPKHHRYFIDNPRDDGFNSQDVFAETNRILLEKGQIINW